MTSTTDPQALRDRIAEALIAWTYRGKDPEHGGILETVRANAYSRADAVLAVLQTATLRELELLHRPNTTPSRPELRRLAAEEQPAETQAHPPSHTWKVESPRRDTWASWGATYDDRDWAQERYESATSTAPARPFRLVRATTTYTVEAEHTPPTQRPVVGEQPDTQETP